MTSFHLAIKDCRTLERFEELASNGCLTLQKGISPWGILPACSVHGHGRIDAFAGHFLISLVKNGYQFIKYVSTAELPVI